MEGNEPDAMGLAVRAIGDIVGAVLSDVDGNELKSPASMKSGKAFDVESLAESNGIENANGSKDS